MNSAQSDFNVKFDELKDSLDKINEKSEVKRPLISIASILTVQNEKIEAGFNEMHERMDRIEQRLSDILGDNKGKDHITIALECQSKLWLEKRYGRSFQQSHMLKCEDGEIEEIHLYSPPLKKNHKHIMAQCTVALLNLAKVLKCVRKRSELAKEMKVDKAEDIIVYIFAFRIDKNMREQIIMVANEYGVKLEITAEAFA